MSHLCKIATLFKNVQALRAACVGLGWTVHENQPVRFYRGPSEICEFVAEFGQTEEFSRTYNVGFQRQPDGTYRVLIDNSIYGAVILEEGKLGGQTPRILNSLKQRYGLEVMRAKVQQKGGRVHVQQAADGSLVLDITGGAFGAR